MQLTGWFAPVAGVLGVILLLFAATLVRRWLRRKRKPKWVEPDLRIDVSRVELRPVLDLPKLLFHGEPVRLDIVILAPAGRTGTLPPPRDWPVLMEAIAPGLMRVVQAHEPQFIRWPAQLSVNGFVHQFFRNVVLPGDRGRGTPFCAAVGPARNAEGQLFLVGMVMHADHPLFLSLEEVESETMWRRLIEVRARP
ncbi:hypothetical protein [Thermogutta sp.]|jgi:hypothetical protein|uniref:hypothetical protein n=1 Tax=Thermogutta sp. TaxID=1962930 RepID=UPI00321F9802